MIRDMTNDISSLLGLAFGTMARLVYFFSSYFSFGACLCRHMYSVSMAIPNTLGFFNGFYAVSQGMAKGFIFFCDFRVYVMRLFF